MRGAFSGQALVALALLAGGSPPATATTITPVQDMRFVRSEEVGFDCGEPSTVAPDPAFSEFSESTGCISGSATQQSTVGPTELAAIGYVGSTGGGHSNDAESQYEITFSVAEPTSFAMDLLAFWTSFSDDASEILVPNPGTGFSVSLFEVGPGVPVFVIEVPLAVSGSPPAQTVSIDAPTTSLTHPVLGFGFFASFGEQGVLDAGTYTLRVSVRSEHERGTSAGFDALFTVPEPSTAVLLGFAVTGALLASRKPIRGPD